MFVLLTLLCAPISAAPLGLLSIRLLLWILLVGVGILNSRRCLIFSPVTFTYGGYLIFLLFSLFYTPVLDYGFRTFLKYLLPFLILLYVPGIITTPHVFIKGMRCVIVIFSIAITFFIIGWSGIPILSILGLVHIFWWGPAIIDSFSVFCSVSIVYSAYSHNKHYLWLLFPMFLIPLLFSIRTGLITTIVTLLAMVFFRYKMKSIPFLILILFLGISSVVFIPQIRNKMFYQEMTASYLLENYQYLSKDDIDTSGRFAMWEWLLRDYYEPHKLTGSGLGIQQYTLYHRVASGDGALTVAHCDYVQMLCDTGLFGIGLYCFVIFSMIWHTFLIYNDQKLSRECRYSALIAGTSICGLVAAMMTDNVVNYTMVTLVYPFTFYAIAIGLKQRVFNVQCHHSSVQ